MDAPAFHYRVRYTFASCYPPNPAMSCYCLCKGGGLSLVWEYMSQPLTFVPPQNGITLEKHNKP